MGGTEMAYKIAGGSKWWQVRAGSGVEGEWIVMKKDWKEANGGKGRRGSRTPDKKSKSCNFTSDFATPFVYPASIPVICTISSAGRWCA